MRAARAVRAIGDDFPSQEQVVAALPDRIVRDGEIVTIDGLDLRFVHLPGNNAPVNTLVHLPDHGVVFSSEVVEDAITVFLKDADLDVWLGQLDRLGQRFPDAGVLYPAHGSAGPPDVLIDELRTHLTLYRDGIDAALADDGAVDEAEAAALAARIEARYPDYTAVARVTRPELIALNIQWQAARRGAQ